MLEYLQEVEGDVCPYCGTSVVYWGKWDHELHLWQCPKCHKLMDQQELIESMPFEALDYYKQCRDSEIKD